MVYRPTQGTILLRDLQRNFERLERERMSLKPSIKSLMEPLLSEHQSPLQRVFVEIRNKLQVIEAASCEDKIVHGAVLQINTLLTRIQAIAHCPLDTDCPVKKMDFEFPKPKPKRKKKDKPESSTRQGEKTMSFEGVITEKT